MAAGTGEASRGSTRRTQVVLVILLMLMGSCGVSNGVAGWRAGEPPEIEDDGSLDPATLELAETLGEVLYRAPLRRTLAAANVVVSLLLPIAAATVLTRRASMRWWVTQSALANGVWTGLDVGSQVTALLDARDRLVPLIERELAQRRAADPGLGDLDPQSTAPTILYALAGAFVAFGVARLAVYVAAVWLARRIRTPRGA